MDPLINQIEIHFFLLSDMHDSEALFILYGEKKERSVCLLRRSW